VDAARGEYRPLRIKVTMPRFTMTQRSLGDADVLALRGLLYLRYKRANDIARKDAAAALAIDRTNILAHQVMYALDKTIAADDARATAAAHPNDHRAWLLIATALGDGDAAIAKACSLAAGVVSACPGAIAASKDARR
jgi:hypothetical protein